MVYLVSYDLKPSFLRDARSFYQELEQSPGWWHYLDRTWMIVTNETERQVYDRLRRHLNDNDLLLIISVRPPYTGQLPPEAWEWVEQQQRDLHFF